MAEIRTSPQYVTGSDGPQRLIVIGAGIASTIVALVAVYFLNSAAGVNVLGWHLDYVIPGGAALIGAMAGSGYGIASWLTGLKIRRWLLVTILVFQIIAFAAAQYAIFVSLGPLYFKGTDHRLTFPEYFHFETMNFAWKEEKGKTGEALGAWGYLFRGLEVAGFALGALIVPGVLFWKPYCANCQAYMRSRQIKLVGASVPSRRVKSGDTDGKQKYAREQDDAFAAAQQQIGELCRAGAAGDIDSYRAALAQLPDAKRAISKLPARIAIVLVRCKRCNAGYLQTRLITGQGKKIKTRDLARTDLPAGWASQIS
jgi:hypothetical protein